MNINIGGIRKTLEKNPALIAFAIGAYTRVPNLNTLFKQYTTHPDGFLTEIENTLTMTGLLKHKLWDAPHLNTKIFKYSTIARVLAELNILVPPKYKKMLEQIMLGSGAACLTLPGSGSLSSKVEQGGSSGGWRSS